MKKQKMGWKLLLMLTMLVMCVGCGATVSYTHLDVYKRQSPESAKRNMVKNIRQGDKNQAWSGSLVNMERKACRKNDKSGGCPVSYTHLDVYKRQKYRSWSTEQKFDEICGWHWNYSDRKHINP